MAILRGMARRPTTKPTVEEEPPPSVGGGFGSVLRGSVNSMVGAAGLNLPLRAVERLTSSIENASAILVRLERATTRLDELDDDFLDRAYETLDILAAMREDTRVISERVVAVEEEVRELRTLITQRFDQVPLLRRRRGGVAADEAVPRGGASPRRRGGTRPA